MMDKMEDSCHELNQLPFQDRVADVSPTKYNF